MIKFNSKTFSITPAPMTRLDKAAKRFEDEFDELQDNLEEISKNAWIMSISKRHKLVRQCVEEIGDMIYYSNEVKQLRDGIPIIEFETKIRQSIENIIPMFANNNIKPEKVYELAKIFSDAKTELHDCVSNLYYGTELNPDNEEGSS